MLRRLLAFLVFGMSVTSITAAAVAQEDTDTSPSDQNTSEAQEPAPQGAPPAASPPAKREIPAPAAVEVKPEAKPEEKVGGWKTEINGYFRAPMALGISQRRDAQDGKEVSEGPKRLQLAYGPNRVIDSSYYSFAYTTMQELDWAELFIHAKKDHVDAVVGWLGYWFGAAGYRNYDASWAPGMAYLTLDTDLDIGGIKPNLAFTVGAFWPQFGYHQKYDTYTLGRFRMLGEQLKLTIPINEDLTLKIYEGFGTNRDGSFSFQQNNPLYAGKTGVDLITFGHLQVSYGKMLDVGLHYNYTFTRDPNLTAQASVGEGKTYANARQA